eukprot:g77344.t1
MQKKSFLSLQDQQKICCDVGLTLCKVTTSFALVVSKSAKNLLPQVFVHKNTRQESQLVRHILLGPPRIQGFRPGVHLPGYGPAR